MDSPIFNNHFWSILKRIDELEEMVNLESFLSEFATEDFNCEMVYDVLQFLNTFNYQVQIEEIKGEKFLLPNKRNERIHFDMSFSEWVALQAHFPIMKDYENFDFHKTLQKKFAEVKSKYPDFTMNSEEFDPELIYSFKENLTDLHQKYVAHIEEAFKTGALLFIHIDNKIHEVFPHKLIMLEGELTIIGEETVDRCLISYTMDEITKIKLNTVNDYIANYSRIEVDEFIMAIRAVSGREERLVLKIDQDEPVNLNPAYQFMGHPYMTANAEGDFIWAASVEISSELYDWLMSMGNKVEILDPVGIKSEFEKYQEIRLKDLHKVNESKKKLKKAS